MVIANHGVRNLPSVANALHKSAQEAHESPDPADVLVIHMQVRPSIRHLDHDIKILNGSCLHDVVDQVIFLSNTSSANVSLGAQMLVRGRKDDATQDRSQDRKARICRAMHGAQK